MNWGIADNTESYEEALRERILVRLDTLMRLRWYAIIGQAVAVLVVAFGFQYSMPWQVCLVVVGISLALNLWLARKYKANYRMPENGAVLLLVFDLSQLAILLFLTGGLQNPFVILLMAPVVVSATSLHRSRTFLLGALALVIISFLAVYHLPLPWEPGNPMKMPFVFVAGIWAAFVCTLAFTTIYVFRVAQETRKLADALAATQLVLQREQHLTSLDGLAAAAAHELGTPLATIAIISKEMMNELPKKSEMYEDAKLLRSQAERCREILQKLTSLTSDNEPIIQEQSLESLVEEQVSPLREFGIPVTIHTTYNESPMPIMLRNPGVQYSLGNLIDNAVDFAAKSVVVTLWWTSKEVRVGISDDGEGFSPSILSQIGEPYISSHQSRSENRNQNRTDGHSSGMGLGLFIAKILLERSGADLDFGNNICSEPHNSGACVTINWPRERFESGTIKAR